MQFDENMYAVTTLCEQPFDFHLILTLYMTQNTLTTP